MEEIYRICRLAMQAVVRGDYAFLRAQNALTRVPEEAVRRVLREYNPCEAPVMPPEEFFSRGAYVIPYRDGSGCHVDINIWYPSGESDLTLQLDIRKQGYIIDDIRVL